METLITIFNTSCCFFTASYIAKTYLHQSCKPRKVDFPVLMLLVLACTFLPHPNGIFLWAFSNLVYLLYICHLDHKDSLPNRFLFFCLVHSTMLLIEGIFSVPLLLLLRLVHLPDVLSTSMLNLLLMLFILFLLRHTKLKNLFNTVKNASLPFRIIVINSYLVLLFVLLFFKFHDFVVYQNTVAPYIYSYCALGIFLVLINVWILSYDHRTRLQQQEIKSYQKNLPIYDSLIHEITDNQHKYMDRLQSFSDLPDVYKDYDTLSAALKAYTKEYENPMRYYPLLQINMPLLAASLYSMASHAQEKGIALQFDIVNAVLESHAPEHELTDYITILTQNAIEACKAGDTIYALLDSKEGSVRYEIRNPVPAMISPEEIGNFFKRGYSTKQTQAGSDAASKQASSDATSKQADDKRGLGLYYLQTNVTKSGGSVGADCVCYEGSYFIIFRLIL